MLTAEQIKDYINAHDEQFVVHCPKEEDAIKYLSLLADIGFIWSDNIGLIMGSKIETRWNQKKSDTCYTFIPGSNIVLTGRKKFYQNKGLNIIEFEDFENQFSEIITPYKHDEDSQEKVLPFKNEDISENEETNNVDEVIMTGTKDSLESNNTFFCVNCGQEINANSKFCFRCGTKVEKILEEKKSDSNTEEKEIKTSNITEEKIIKPNVEEKDIINNKPVLEVDKDTTNEKTDLESNTNILLDLLSLKEKQEFVIVGDQNEYYSESIFRFNNNKREIKVGDNMWFVSNNEQELIYIINHPQSIKKL